MFDFANYDPSSAKTSPAAELAILTPTYKRPLSLARLARNVEATTSAPFKLYFGLEAEDEAGIAAAKATGHSVVVNKYEPGYSNTIQSMYEADDSPLLIHANDDFEFLPHWDELPRAMFERPDLMVVGLKQTEADASYSTISMFRREYIEEQSGVIDMPDRIFYPYNHNYVDTEFTETAQSRGVWAPCEAHVIKHQHPGLIGGDKDETYRKNDATVSLDEKTYEQRKHLWK